MAVEPHDAAMKVIYYRSQNGNFGDDLNSVLWKAVLRPACFEADDAVLLGIGSIFREDFLLGQPLVGFALLVGRPSLRAGGTTREGDRSNQNRQGTGHSVSPHVCALLYFRRD